MAIAIKVENLSKAYRLYDNPKDCLKEALHPLRKKYHRDFNALDNISFEINKGERVGIIGKNGSGKSTLLKIISGVLTPSQGLVQVNGKVSALLELGAGFNQQYTGMENIYFNGATMGYSRREIEHKLDEILSFADIGEFVYQPVKTYSSGMFIRLAFAIAVNVEPEILIIDEALSVGDMFFQAKCITKIERMMGNGVTVLFVSHRMDSIKELFSKCIYLKSGTVAAFGPSAEVTDQYVRDTREQINQGLNAIERISPSVENVLSMDGQNNGCRKVFKMNPDFSKNTALFRLTTGEAEVTEVELLDTNEQGILEANFDQQVIVRIHLLFHQDANTDVVYFIRDEKNIRILGSSIEMETNKMLAGKAGEKYVIDFNTRLPLNKGNYNIMVTINNAPSFSPFLKNIDRIENALVFNIRSRKPRSIISKIYCQNQVELYKASN